LPLPVAAPAVLPTTTTVMTPRDTAESSSSSLPLPGTPKTGSLPRQKRRGDLPPSPNVAIVSPMPVLQQREGAEGEEGEKKAAAREDSEDPLQGIAPMAPLGGLFRGRGSERTAVAAEKAVHAALLKGKRIIVLKYCRQ